MGKRDLVDVSVELRSKTPSGLAYIIFDGDKEHTVPVSQCTWDPDAKTMSMPEWLAEDRGLI